uniref:Uncharacterized protein n=1 Tax=Tanacetum cinerariifolium TaxID=118510 RepID=A0A6L2L9E0_TANCI|nr:hypothetical protein [Tanacetum cinerariifolium]
MHHLIVKSNFVEGKTTKLDYGGGEGKNNVPVCPKPRRPRSTNPREVLKPFKCTNAHSQSNLDGRSEILSMIITDKERETFCYYQGSPPQRIGNPLIHDVHFVNQVKLFSPLATLKN